ncbi:MAG: histidine triad nucleotide-binding protein [Anaerolinea sp.]|nr:histidine triad nucleotide-binding protein [Anaerolinea sp.]
MTSDCIFCKIIAGEIPGQFVYQDEQVVAFRDIHPIAPTHILIAPRKHFDSVHHVDASDEPLLGHLFTAARLIAEQEKVSQSGYRLVVNTGAGAGQTVFHIHMHLLAGKPMSDKLV